ncbi:unnamed protein product [Cuscuta europaea]|uniref:Secreted protein n=1 Tax=Cuscuta europaea TaxID=41803 RepID=A0A9P1E334_CUSEU|nr:unnamed protein product [Cuscuta europaea]
MPGMLTASWFLIWTSSHFPQYHGEDEPIDCTEIINRCLMLRTGPVKKFTLVISHFEHYNIHRKILSPLSADIDRWCLFLSRNGIEELHISIVIFSKKHILFMIV